MIAVGAILRYAVTITATGFNLHTIGTILMIVGGIGIALSLAFWSSWGGVGGARRGTVADGVVRRRRVVEDEVV